jgi:hypothetical protein
MTRKSFGVVALAMAGATACIASPGTSGDSNQPQLETTAAASAELSSAGALRSFSCEQTNTGRAAYKQRVTGQLNAASQPLNVKIFRGPNATLEHSAATSTLVPDYSGGYFERTYGLVAWSLGSEGTNDYYLLLPEAGVTGATFGGQLHLQFNHGSYGWWQKILSCTVQ